MTSTDLYGGSFKNCTWLAGSVFHRYSAEYVYNKTLDIKNILVVNQSTARTIPLSVCPCSKSKNISNCYLPNLGETSPGKTISVELMISKQWLWQQNLFKTTIVAETISDDDVCNVVNVLQLSQTYYNQDCNEYKYTLWPQNTATKTCKLFLGLNGMPEMFYVKLKNCPIGFTLQKRKQKCDCDPILSFSPLLITSCNLDDETIKRPSHSWVFAVTQTSSLSYKVSPYCPSDYCWPQSSHLNLSTPDSQCLFNRSGILCGQCQPGLSAVFGSSRCMRCSNVYLSIIIPVAIAGFILLLLLFIFNLTIINGTVNTFIFYVNILNINILVLFPSCKPLVACILISLFNLDLGITTCFYNGMNDYAKAWLQLVFPSYMLAIASLLIIMSRYSARVQRLTAQRALPVLATLFLLSYTKLLQTVCKVLFSYGKITHLSNSTITTEYVWSIDTVAPLFGLKFTLIFVVCFILFFILLPFNLVLLCTRKLSYFKLVTTFKPLLDTYSSSHKDNAFYWTGLQLLVRAIVLALSGLLRDTSLLAIVILLCVVLSLQGIVRPFRNRINNIQESLLLLNLLLAHVAPLNKDEEVGLTIAQIAVAIGLVYLIMALTYHCVMFKWKSIICNYFNRICSVVHKLKSVKKYNATDSITMVDFRSRIADLTYNYKEFRDSLIGYDK